MSKGNIMKNKTVSLLTIFVSLAISSSLLFARDRGFNQPGAVGNTGRDPGINQPGAVGNVGRDPGINQPGAVGNVSRDPGINQPGRLGNRRR